MRRFLTFFALLFALFTGAAFSAGAAVEIQRLSTSEHNIPVWLVEAHQLPFVSVEISFAAGSAFDPPGKEGLAMLAASLINEGAGELPSTAFQQAVETIGARLGGDADKLYFSVRLDSLSQHTDRAFELLGLSLIQPRFDEEALERMRAGLLSSIRRGGENPATVAAREFSAALLGAHPYAHPTEGTEESLTALKRADVQAFAKKYLTRANMVVSVVGDISPARLTTLLDKTLSGLPEGDKRHSVTLKPAPPLPQMHRVEMAVPQSTILTGHLGPTRHDPDYFAAIAMNHVLGGSGFTARLTSEIREKRGLAYSTGSGFSPLPLAGIFTASAQTKNADAPQTLRLIKEEIGKMHAQGPTAEEHRATLDYLLGSFPLRLDSNRKILGYLTVMQMEDLGTDYLEKWTTRMGTLTREDLARAARRFLHPENLVTVIVGGPDEKSD